MAPPSISRRSLIKGGSASLLTSLSGLPSARAAAAPSPVTIANTAGALNQTMAELMRQQRFLESFNLAPDILALSDGAKILAGIISGGVDLSLMSGFGQIFPAIARGGGLKVVGGGALSPALAMFTAKAGINSLKDLEGKTVGTGAIGALVHQLVVTLLRKEKVDPSKVTFVNVGSSVDILRAVSAGVVAAGPGPSSLIANAANHHLRPIPGGNMTIALPEYTYEGAWTSDRAIRTKRDILVRSLAAYAKLYRFAQSPGARDAFMNARRRVFSSQTQTDHDAEWNFVQTYKPFAVDLVLSPERLNYMQALNVSFHVQNAILPFAQVADMSLARDALKLLR